MTPQEKIDRVIRWLTESHLFSHGGYPYDCTEYHGRLFVAELDDSKERGRTLIQSYCVDDLVAWYDRAEQFMRECGCDMKWPNHCGEDFGDWWEGFSETEPNEDNA